MNTTIESAEEDNIKYDRHSSTAIPSETRVPARSDGEKPAVQADELAPTVWPSTAVLRGAMRCSDPNCSCQSPTGNVHCPAHDDRTPSLSLNEKGGKPLWHCHAGCDQNAVTRAIADKVHSSDTEPGNQHPRPYNRDYTATENTATDNTGTRPSKTLRERGLTLDTKTHFGIEEYFGGILSYPTYLPDGQPGRLRVRSTRAGSPKFRWRGTAGLRPSVYNLGSLVDAERTQHGIFVVEGEPDVWTMHQNGFAAVSTFGSDADAEALARELKSLGISRVRAVYDNDLTGRERVLKLRDILQDRGITVEIAVLSGALGFDISDLFAQVKFDARKFREEIGMLPLLPPLLSRIWETNPGFGLPEASTDTDDGLLPCLGEEQLERLDMPKCLVRRLLLQGRPTIFTGMSNLGKSAIAMDVSLSICTGLEWNGQPVHQGGVFYLAAEGANGIAKRLKAWKKFKGIAEVPNFRVFPAPLVLENAGQRARLIHTIQHHDPNPALVVIDTLSRCSGAADENSSTEMGRFVESADEICRATGAAVLIIHHNNRTGAFRGSSALPANCDGHLLLVGETSGAKVKLQVAKLKDFADGHKFPLQRQVVTLEGMLDDQGDPQTAAVFIPDDRAETEDAGSGPGGVSDGLKPKERDALNALLELIAAADVAAGRSSGSDSGALGDTDRGTDSAPPDIPHGGSAQNVKEHAGSGSEGMHTGVSAKEWAAAALRAGVSSASFDRAKKRLLELEVVRCEEPGTSNARFFYLKTLEDGLAKDGAE